MPTAEVACGEALIEVVLGPVVLGTVVLGTVVLGPGGIVRNGLQDVQRGAAPPPRVVRATATACLSLLFAARTNAMAGPSL
jgi:hypothetical protein